MNSFQTGWRRKTVRIAASLITVQMMLAGSSVFGAAVSDSARTRPGGGSPSEISETPPPQVWRYTLLEGSYLIRDCPVCDGPTLLQPMEGTFDLRLVEENPIQAVYAVENIAFKAGFQPGGGYTVSGGGAYEIGGEVALRQELVLETWIDDGARVEQVWLTNTSPQVPRLWPMIGVDATQTNGTLLRLFQLEIRAAPLREIWFSTRSGMTSGNRAEPFQHISGGDLLSRSGRVIKTNHELTGQLGLMPVAPDVGLDAVDVLAGGEIAFSIPQDVFSESVGDLRQGDLLSDQGRIVKRFEALLASFAPMPPVPEVGLDAVQVQDDQEILFSSEQEFFSQALGLTLRPGDLLSSSGRIVKRNAELLARFHPPAADKASQTDYGLDALYVWPSGEIWFSLEAGFQDGQLGPIQAGDLLSDQGYIICRNLDLTSRFAPLEDLSDFGLDALVIVTDVLPAGASPRFTRIELSPTREGIRLEWEGRGRFFQVEGADPVGGPYELQSPIVTDHSFEVEVSSDIAQHGYFRLRQW